MIELPVESDFETVDGRNEIVAAFEALKAATPEHLQKVLGRLMLMGRTGVVYHFKHRDMRRSFRFDIVTGAFSGQDDEGEINSVEQAYYWACS